MRFGLAFPLALCQLGALAAITLVLDDSGAEPEPEWDAEQRHVLKGVKFPVFAPEGLEAELSGWGGGEGRSVTSVSLVHHDEPRMVDVESEFDGDTPEDDYMVEAADRLEGAVSETKTLRVDGVERQFAFASAKDEWVAIARVGDVTITVQARGFDPSEVHLRALADPANGLDEYRRLRPAYDVLDPRRVEELAAGTTLARLGKPLAGVALPALALQLTEDAQPNWFGGTPQLPADARWPEGEYGPMMFVTQLSLADLDRSVWKVPAAGHLHVFCAADPESGAIEGPDSCTIQHSPAGASLQDRDFPSDLDENNRLPRFDVKPQPGLSLPAPAVPLMQRLGLGFTADSEYEELWTLKRRLESEQGWHDPYGHLLGWPEMAGEDLMTFFVLDGGGRPQDWTLLLHTNALDADLDIGIRTADLAAGRFDRVEATIEFD